MKFTVATLLMLPALTAAFIPTQPRAFVGSSLNAKAAKSKEEDLELTRQVINAFAGGSSAPVEEPVVEDEESSEEEE